jgi:hypothetical protein
MATTLIITPLNIFGNGTQKIFHVLLRLLSITLASQKLREEYLYSERWRRGQLWLWLWLMVVDVVCTTPTSPCTVTTSFGGLIRGTASVCHLHIPATSNN